MDNKDISGLNSVVSKPETSEKVPLARVTLCEESSRLISRKGTRRTSHVVKNARVYDLEAASGG